MEIDRVHEIARDVADGAAPYAGDRLPADGPYQRVGQGNRPPDSSPEPQPGPVDREDCPF